MDNDPFSRLLSRVSKLETGNRLIGGHDYPVIPCVVTSRGSIDSSGAVETTSTSLVNMWAGTGPMQNPKMGFRFFVKNLTGGETTNWTVHEVFTNTDIASGSVTSTSALTVVLHIDVNAIFDYGTFASWTIKASTTGGGTASVLVDYMGGSYSPDTAVAF